MFSYEFSVTAKFDARVYLLWTFWVLSSFSDHYIQSSAPALLYSTQCAVISCKPQNHCPVGHSALSSYASLRTTVQSATVRCHLLQASEPLSSRPQCAVFLCKPQNHCPVGHSALSSSESLSTTVQSATRLCITCSNMPASRIKSDEVSICSRNLEKRILNLEKLILNLEKLILNLEEIVLRKLFY